MSKGILWLLAAGALTFVLRAQDSSIATLKGELLSESLVLNAVAQLVDVQSNRAAGYSEISADGRFEFRDIAYGGYTLRITDHAGHVMEEKSVEVDRSTAPVLVRIERPKTSRPPVGGVSFQALLHPPSPKAIQAVAAAQKLSEKGNYAGAAVQLERAIRISPDFADAYTNLAAQHLRLGQYEQGLAELQRSLALGGPNATVLSNIAFAQAALSRFDDAARSARHALELEPDRASAHYLLGSLLALDDPTLVEAVQHLQIASRTMPSAAGLLEKARHQLSAIHR